jgi:hypothetical protein
VLNKIVFTSIIFISTLFLACKPSNSEDALEYNNQIVSIQDELTSDIDTFLQSVNYPDANTAILFKSAQNTSQAVSDKLKTIVQFEGGTALFLETQNYINTCQSSLQNEGSEIVHIKAKLSINYNEKDVKLLNDKSDSLFRKVNSAAEKFDKVQNEFAKKYHFDIERTEDRLNK